MSAAEYKAQAAAYTTFKRPSKRQQESISQKMFVKALNLTGLGFFYRIRNGGTFDPVRKAFRKNAELVALPDIAGYLHRGSGVFIEVKYVQKIEQKKKLIFKVKITDKQKEFLLAAFRSGQRAGVAFTLADCMAIVFNDGTKYPRHPRTYCFLPDDEQRLYAEQYQVDKTKLAAINADPVARDVLNIR